MHTQAHSTTRSPTQRAFLRFLKNKAAVASLIFICFLVLAVIIGPWIIPHDPNEMDLIKGASPPDFTHWMGTDIQGRDLLSRCLTGGRVSLQVGLLGTLVASVIGITYGALSGYCGGRVDNIMMRIVEILYALPFTVFVILLVTIFGQNFYLIFIAIGAVEWLTMARIVRGQVSSLRHSEYIAAAHVLGQSPVSIIARHILPNTLGPIIIYTTLTIPNVMLLEAFISFLGLGVQPPDTSWGSLISDGAKVIEEYPWILIFPSLFFSLSLFALNYIGDSLRDAFDPRSELN